MSHYVECTPGFKDREALIEALVAVGFDRGQIEIHEEVVPLYGYQGDERPQRAHIVIRRQHVGQAANDVGWERLPDGTYRAWISEYDGRHRFNPEMQNRIKQEYAYHAVARQQRALGRRVEGSVRLRQEQGGVGVVADRRGQRGGNERPITGGRFDHLPRLRTRNRFRVSRLARYALFFQSSGRFEKSWPCFTKRPPHVKPLPKRRIGVGRGANVSAA